MSAKTMTAESAYRSVIRSAEKIRNDDPATVPTMSPGDVVRQGDLYLTYLDVAPRKAADFAGRQLAPGATQGSRHVARGECELYRPDESEAVAILNRLVPATRGHRQFVGPVVAAEAPVEIAHPEHGDRVLPAGTYLVTYQRTWADEVRRTLD